jgi:GNAT superfamily N-acetyltransferase
MPSNRWAIRVNNLNYSIIDVLDESLRESINVELRRYNREKNPAFYAMSELPAGAPRALNVVAFDAAKNPIGGLIAETLLSWLKVSIVSVRDDCRSRGVGSHLMALAEEEALRRECKYSFLDTMDYQAPDFYQKLGYQICGRLDDWDSHGHAKYFLRKSLVVRSRR